MIATREPRRLKHGDVWTANSGVVELLPQPRLHDFGVSMARLLQFVSLFYIVLFTVVIHAEGQEHLYTEREYVLRSVIMAASYFSGSLLFARMVSQDDPRLRCRRPPFPIIFFTSLTLNWLSTIAWLSLPIILTLASGLRFEQSFAASPVHGESAAARLSNAAAAAAGLFMALVVSFDFAAIAWYAIQYHRHYLPISKMSIEWDTRFSLSDTALSENSVGRPDGAHEITLLTESELSHAHI